MIQHVCMIFDNQVKEYSSPSFVSHVEEAKRNFEVACKSSGSLLSMFPVYELRHVADFDTVTCEFQPVLNLTILCSSADFIKE